MSILTRREPPALPTFVLLLILLLQSGCDSPSDPGLLGSPPPETGDGWRTATLESVGMAPEPLEAMLELIDETSNHLIHSVLIVRGQRLVFEEYWPGTDLAPGTLNSVVTDFDRETLHYVASVSKSVTSALAGIAVREGWIGSVDEPVFSYFPEYEWLKDAQNEEIRVRHLLTFSSGYEWNEFVYGFEDPRDSHFRMFASQDPVEYLLGRPMTGVPGAAFHYNSGDTNLLGEIIRRESPAATLVDFAYEHLFDPLGIEDMLWTRFAQAPSMTFASGGVYLRPRDMAKLGQLYLDGGSWNGIQVIPSEWVRTSTEMQLPLYDHGSYSGYGYNWWLGSLPFQGARAEFFAAVGWGGQYIFVFPELDLVVVFTAGGYYESRPLSFGGILVDFILQSVDG